MADKKSGVRWEHTPNKGRKTTSDDNVSDYERGIKAFSVVFCITWAFCCIWWAIA